MRQMLYKSANFSAKDSINSRSAAALQDVENATVIHVIAAAAMITDDEEDGEKKNVSVLVTEEHDYFTAISATVFDVMNDVVELLDAEGSLDIKVVKRTSNSGREFLTLIIL